MLNVQHVVHSRVYDRVIEFQKAQGAGVGLWYCGLAVFAYESLDCELPLFNTDNSRPASDVRHSTFH